MKNQSITLSDSEKIGFISNLCTMLSAGISILEIVDSLLEDAKGSQKKILETLREDLIQGKRLYSTFSKFPSAFDKVTVNIIRAAEEAGTLEITLKDLKENIKKEIEFSDKVKAALAYPLLIVVVFIGVLLMILTFIIPKIATVFSRLKLDLPLPTKILIFVSNTLLTYTLPIIVVSLLIFLIFFLLYKTKKKLLFSLLTCLPILSNLTKEIDLTKFSRSLSLLLTAGIPITYALELTHDVVVKKEIAEAISHAKEVVLAGKRLSEGFKDAKVIFPSIMIKITEAGEKSGSLEKSMQDISEYLDYQVTKSLRTATTLLEPLMLIVVGILIGGLMLSIMAPIYGLISQVGSR